MYPVFGRRRTVETAPAYLFRIVSTFNRAAHENIARRERFFPESRGLAAQESHQMGFPSIFLHRKQRLFYWLCGRYASDVGAAIDQKKADSSY